MNDYVDIGNRFVERFRDMEPTTLQVGYIWNIRL